MKHTIETYYQAMIKDELDSWLHKAGAPDCVECFGTQLGFMEYRHQINGIRWTVRFTGGLEATGWISLNGECFDMDTRPDAHPMECQRLLHEQG